MIDRAWDERDALCGRIASGLAELRPRARMNTDLALSLLSSMRKDDEADSNVVRG